MNEDNSGSWKVQFFESRLGHGGFSNHAGDPADRREALLSALSAWGDLADEADNAAATCLRFAGDSDPHIRAGVVAAIGNLLPNLNNCRDEAVAAVFRALSDANDQVRKSAEHVAQTVKDKSGITGKPTP